MIRESLAVYEINYVKEKTNNQNPTLGYYRLRKALFKMQESIQIRSLSGQAKQQNRFLKSLLYPEWLQYQLH